MSYRIIIIPISYLRRLDSLKYTSFVALVSIAYLVILVLAHFIKGDTERSGGDLRLIQWAGAVPALSSFPVIVFAFTCHQNVCHLSKNHGLPVQADIDPRCFLFLTKLITILTIAQRALLWPALARLAFFIF